MYKYSVSGSDITDYNACHNLIGHLPDFARSLEDFEGIKEVQELKSVAAANVHISYTKNALGKKETQQLMYALLMNKPIVVLNVPAYRSETTLFARELINSRLSKILLCDITLFDKRDLHDFLSNAAKMPVNYKLTRHEQTLIKSLLRSSLRSSL